MNKKEAELNQRLDFHYEAFDKSQLKPDPLQFPHIYRDEKDIEAMAFLSSLFAYGNITQIINSLEKLRLTMNDEPFNYIRNYSYYDQKSDFISFKHRFYTEKDIAALFHLLNLVYKNYSSLKDLFLKHYNDDEENLKLAISGFSNYFLNLYREEFGSLKNGIKFMFPLPKKGSACKRMNLFLRWMIRKDDLDFGLWNDIPTSKLVIPVDTHIARICKELSLTSIKNVSWKMAEEITNNLKKFDAVDPVKYDFAICHIGIRKLKF